MSTLQCPQCGQHTVVPRSLSLYQCIACEFERDLDNQAESEEKSSDSAFGAMIIVVVILLLLL